MIFMYLRLEGALNLINSLTAKAAVIEKPVN